MRESVGYLDHGAGELDPESSCNDLYFGRTKDDEGDPDAAYDEWRESQSE